MKNGLMESQFLRTRRKSLIVTSVITSLAGGALCTSEYGTMFWGNWLHSASFTLGLAAICVAAATFAGAVSGSMRVVIYMVVVMTIMNLFFLWTFLGWMALHQLIWNFLHPEG